MKMTALKIKKKSSYTTYRRKSIGVSLLISTINIEKNAQFILMALLFAGLPTVAVIYTKKFSTVATLGVDNLSKRLTLHFVFTDIALCTPYLDLIAMMSAKDKRKVMKDFFKKVKKFCKIF